MIKFDKSKFLEQVTSFLTSGDISITFENIAYIYIEEVLESLGFIDREMFSTNGWQIDYWNEFKKDNLTLKLSGSMYYGELSIEKEYD